jgi:hypothetical protein
MDGGRERRIDSDNASREPFRERQPVKATGRTIAIELFAELAIYY